MEIISKNKKPLLFLLAMFGLFSILVSLAGPREITRSSVRVGDATVLVSVADSDAERTQGLSGTESLGEKEGMLFIFESGGVYKFWMKDMNFPIDIIWFDENRKIIYIEKNATPESFPGSFGPDQNSLYVLEVPAGFSEKNNLELGDMLELNLK